MQAGLALAQVWHSSSVGEQVQSGLALARVGHLSSPVILDRLG